MTNASKISQGTLVLNDYIFKSKANGEYLSLEADGELVTMEIGADGTLIMAQNLQGEIFKLSIKVIRGTEDYSFLLNALNQQKADFYNTPFLEGTYTTTSYNGSQKVADTFIITAGTFSKYVSKMSDASGNIEANSATFEITCKAQASEN